MNLVKEIHSAVLRNQLHPSESREKNHAFLTGVHASAATVARYNERAEKIDTAIANLGEFIEKLDKGEYVTTEWEVVITRAKEMVKQAKEAIGLKSALAMKQPEPIADITPEELLGLIAMRDHFRPGDHETLGDVFDGLWEEGADVSKYKDEFAATMLESIKAAGYVRITNNA